MRVAGGCSGSSEVVTDNSIESSSPAVGAQVPHSDGIHCSVYKVPGHVELRSSLSAKDVTSASGGSRRTQPSSSVPSSLYAPSLRSTYPESTHVGHCCARRLVSTGCHIREKTASDTHICHCNHDALAVVRPRELYLAAAVLTICIKLRLKRANHGGLGIDGAAVCEKETGVSSGHKGA